MHSTSDSRSLHSTTQKLKLIFLIGFLSVTLATRAVEGLTYTYENTISGAIPESGAFDTSCNGGTPLVRTFSVSDSFTVRNIALGFNASHTNRGDIRAILIAPGGTSAVFIANSGDSDDNYDILLSVNTEEALDDNDADPVTEPYFSRTATFAGANFYTGNSAGTWTLRVCDRTANSTTGTFNRAYLMLESATAVTSTCSSIVSYDWGLLGGTGVNPTPLLGHPVTVGNITISQLSAIDHGGTASDAFVMRNTTNGNHSGYYGLSMDAATLAGTQDNESVGLTSVIGFSVPIRDLSFQLLDVDIGSWEDQIQVIGTDAGGNRVPYTIAPVAGGSAQMAGDIAEGDASAATNSTSGNLNVAFNGAVSSLTLNYTQGSNPAADNNFMVIGLSDFIECAYDFGDAPLTYGSAGQVLGNRTVYLGNTPPDGEAASPAAPNAAATTDDITTAAGGGDDENGVPSFPNTPIVAGGTYTVPGIVVNNSSGAAVTLCGWIDFDTNGQAGDGTFESNEGSCITVPASGSNASCTSVGTTFTCSMTWTVPADYVRNNASGTYARFRVSTGALSTSGFNDVSAGAPSTNAGEVEDYFITASTLPVTLAWVESTPSKGGVVVRFATATETANAGFRIWGTTSEGGRVQLADLKSDVTDSFVPRRYEATVRGASITSIEIEDLSIFGDDRLHGPFAVGSTFGEDPVPDEIDWAGVRSESGVVTPLDRMRSAELAGAPEEGNLASSRRPASPSTGGLLLVREEGIHRVTFEQLLAAGIDLSGAPSASIALVNEGIGMPRYVEAAGGVFGPGAFIEFVARPQLTLASPVDAYVLKIDSRRAISVPTQDPGRGGAGVTAATDHYRPERIYSFASPNGDPWYDARILAWGSSATLSRNFDLPDLVSGAVNLKIRIWGNGDLEGAAPDHHVIVKLNGTEIAERTFDGLTTWEPEVDVSGLASETGNSLEVFVPGDTGYSFDNIAFEGFDISYTRSTVARSARFQGTSTRLRAFNISGFTDSDPVSIWKASATTMTRQARQPMRGVVPAPGGPGDVYAASRGALYRPGIVAGIPTAQLASSAEYLIVTHPSLVGSIGDLVALEESRGLRTEVVTVDKIYAAYSDYASSAAALKSFLSASLKLGNLRYVLLVGADTSDPYDHLGLGSVSFVPTDYRSFTPVVTFSPTDETLVDRQNDGLGDVPIGRLPVRTPAELEAEVAKLYAWEEAIGGDQPSALLTAGLSDGARALSSVNESYAASLASWNTVLAQVDDTNTSAVRQQVLDAINSGAHLVSFVGHSSMGQWDFTPILTWQDVASMTNAGLPTLITSWGCWNSYYVEPTIESLSARLLRQPDAGAAGVIGATTLTSEASHRLLGTLFFARVNAGAATVGEAFHGAKQDLQAQGGAADAIYGMTLLGDPAMSLPRP